MAEGSTDRNLLFGFLALAYRAAGQLDKALPLCKQTLAKRKAKLGADHPNTLTSMNNLAAAYLARDEAEKQRAKK